MSVQLLLWTPATYICLCDATLLPLGHICDHSPYEDALLQSCDFAVVGSIRGSRFANLGRDLDARDWSYSQELLFETLSSPSPWMTRTALRLLCAEMVDVESLRLRCAWCAANGRMSMSCARKAPANVCMGLLTLNSQVRPYNRGLLLSNANNRWHDILPPPHGHCWPRRIPRPLVASESEMRRIPAGL